MPGCDLLDGLGEGVDDDSGFAAPEALDAELGGLVLALGWAPEADDDAVGGQV